MYLLLLCQLSGINSMSMGNSLAQKQAQLIIIQYKDYQTKALQPNGLPENGTKLQWKILLIEAFCSFARLKKKYD